MIRNSMMKSGTNFLNTIYVQRDDPMISEGSFMQAKHLCVLTTSELRVRLVTRKLLNECCKAVLLLRILFLFLSLSYCHVCFLHPCSHLLGRAWPLGSLVFDVFLCLCPFPIQCPSSGKALSCIDS